MDCGRMGWEIQTRSPAVVGTGLPFSLPRVCLSCGGTPKSLGESGAGEALWELKGKGKAASQLANCKASTLVGSIRFARNSLKRAERRVSRTAPKGNSPAPWGWER